MTYRGLILDFGGVLTIRMRLNGQAFERSEGLAPGTYTRALNEHPDGVAVYAALEVGEATQEQWNQVVGGILGIDPTDLMRRALANLHLEPRMVDAARRARAAGIKVAMLSNSFGLTPFNPYEALGMWTGRGRDRAVRAARRTKPDPGIYLHTLELLQLTGRGLRVRRRSCGEAAAGRGAGHPHDPRHRRCRDGGAVGRAARMRCASDVTHTPGAEFFV